MLDNLDFLERADSGSVRHQALLLSHSAMIVDCHQSNEYFRLMLPYFWSVECDKIVTTVAVVGD